MKVISKVPERLEKNKFYVEWLCTCFIVIKYPIKYTCNSKNIEEELKNNEDEIFITQKAHSVLMGLRAKNSTGRTEKASNIPKGKKTQKACNGETKKVNSLVENNEKRKLEAEKRAEENLEKDMKENAENEITTLEAEKEFWNNFFDPNKDILLDFRKVKFKLELQGWT